MTGVARGIWYNFRIAVWVVIVASAYQLTQRIGVGVDLQATFGPYSVMVGLAPLALLGIELMLWYRPFRRRERGCRLLAAFMGLVLTMAVFVALINANLYERSPNVLVIAVLGYTAVSHFAFAFTVSERR